MPTPGASRPRKQSAPAISRAIAIWSGVWLLAASGRPAAQPPAPQASARAVSADRALLDRYCVTCHNARLKTAGLALDGLDPANVAADAATWEKVTRKLRAGSMPPVGLPRPDRTAAQALVTSLETSLDRAAITRTNPGRIPVHRLNRAEYTNAVRDLLDVEIDGRAMLPADDADELGFDNMADVLSVSPALLERYMSAARKIARLAVGTPPDGPSSQVYLVARLLVQDDRMSEDLPFGSRGGVAVRHAFPADGEYTIQIKLRTNLYDYIRGLGRPHLLQVRLDGARIGAFTIGGEDKGTTAPASFAGAIFGSPEWERYTHDADAKLQLRFTARAGPHVVGVAFAGEARSAAEGVLQPPQVGYPLAIDEMWTGNPAVEHVEIAGPYAVKGPGDTPSRRRIFVCRPAESDGDAAQRACATRIMTPLARRAFRRAVTDKDLAPLVAFFDTGRRTGGFESGVQLALERLLSDPEFLFRIEPDPAGAVAGTSYAVGDLDLASRLSFFLWSSIPDEELLSLATRRQLKAPASLERQVRRLLADPRAKRALVDNFAGQWLELRNVREHTPDPDIFDTFDENLREAFRKETELFIESQLADDRSVVDLLSADYTFVNERLARHYGIPDIYGDRFRRVTFAPGVPRGGLLGQASLLTITSYPNRTSPVLRGKYVLGNILGTPPPPPPADVPALKDKSPEGRVVSVRERLEEHRKNPTCATCHAQMDPLGFALEAFDATGRLRATTEGGAAVDSSGALPDGSKFDGPTGLRELLLTRREQFVRTVTERLLAYALGRRVEYYDLPIVRQIVRDAAPSGYRWSSIILGIVKSAPFQMRRPES